jgi:serpin B
MLAAWVLVAMTAASARSETKMSDGDASFAAALHGKLRGERGNLFYSPASVRIAMAMAAAGARGATATEMHAALALPPGDAAHVAFGKLLADWASMATPPMRGTQSTDAQTQKWQEEEAEHQRVILRVANRLWAQAGHKFRDEFLKILRDDYHAPLGTVDFQKDAEGARGTINKWVSDATEHKIRELIAHGMLTSNTKLVLTNAIYFKAHWDEEFNASATKTQPFFTGDGRDVKVPLMRRIDRFALARVDGAMMAELPYGAGRLVMDVVLPTAVDGIAKVEDAYVKGAMAKWTAALSSARVDLMLPKFHASSSFSLGDKLKELGMPRAFAYPDADFSGIDGGHDLFIGAVVHQAFVDVDEHGTEAAAATAVMMKAGSAMQQDQPIEFRADHPFLFFIRDRTTGVVLFAGRLSDPSAK